MNLLLFRNWTSGNKSIDEYIKETQAKEDNEHHNKYYKLKWIPYDKIKDIEYLDKGGFGIIYKATLLNKTIALKSLNGFNNNSSNEDINEFLNEWKHHNKCTQLEEVIKLYGFTQDPITSNYMIIMDYAEKGSLRKCLTEIKAKLKWYHKLLILYSIIKGINQIHEQDLVHCDLHDGNILNRIAFGDVTYEETLRPYISDLGLCQPIGSSKGNKIFGVVPFVAPEVLKSNPNTQASDIYSFAIIMWEVMSGVPPFNERAHDFQLCLSICKGERPKIAENTPKCYAKLMERCWDEDPSKRPSASEIFKILEYWLLLGTFYTNDIKTYSEEHRSDIISFVRADNNSNSAKPIPKSHPQAYYSSRLLDFTKNLNNILDSYEIGISQSLEAFSITEEDVEDVIDEEI